MIYSECCCSLLNSNLIQSSFVALKVYRHLRLSNKNYIFKYDSRTFVRSQYNMRNPFIPHCIYFCLHIVSGWDLEIYILYSLYICISNSICIINRKTKEMLWVFRTFIFLEMFRSYFTYFSDTKKILNLFRRINITKWDKKRINVFMMDIYAYAMPMWANVTVSDMWINNFVGSFFVFLANIYTWLYTIFFINLITFNE